MFDNLRTLHGRSAVHPTTSRVVHGAYIAEEVWRSRCRIINGQKSGLEEKWVFGCTDEVTSFSVFSRSRVNGLSDFKKFNLETKRKNQKINSNTRIYNKTKKS